MRLREGRDRCLVMGVLNVTPDSFSDGGRYVSVPDALERAATMIGEGADIIDVGGESTRPGADSVTADAELDRVLPIIEALRAEFETTISIDTSKADVMREAVAAGAEMVNDVRALCGERSLETAATLGKPVCLMHMRGEPANMQRDPVYADVVGEVTSFLRDRADACLGAGISAGDIIVDPGFGFGKTLAHNLELLRNLDVIASLGYRVLVGLSRKSMIGQLLERPVDGRLHGGLALAMLARQGGAAIVRTHDVASTVDALRVLEIVTENQISNG